MQRGKTSCRNLQDAMQMEAERERGSMLSKKMIALASAAALAACLALAGCGGTQAASSAAAPAASEASAAAASATAAAESAAASAAATAESAAASAAAEAPAASAEATAPAATTEAASAPAATTGTAAPAADSYIGDQAAIDIALANAGFAVSDVTELEAQLHLDDGAPHYDVSFKQGTTEYDYNIDAATGDIISSHSEVDD